MTGSERLPPDRMAWSLAVRAPISDWADWSKNRLWRKGQGRTYLSGARTVRDQLAALLSRQIAAGGHRVARNVLWLSIHVAKRSHAADAVNALDVVADAVKMATGLDDNWYSLGRLTWTVEPDAPHVQVEIGQRDTADVVVCATCGRLLAPELFTRNRKAATGRGSRCADCRHSKGKPVDRTPRDDLLDAADLDRPPWAP